MTCGLETDRRILQLLAAVLVGVALLAGTGCPPAANTATPSAPFDGGGTDDEAADDAPDDDAPAGPPAPGDPASDDGAATDQLSADLALLPGPQPPAVGVRALDLLPAGVLYALELEDELIGNLLGGLDETGAPEITGASVLTATGRLLLRQGLIDGGSELGISTGDALQVVVTGDGARFVAVVVATDPPSRVVVDVAADGTAVVSESSTLATIANDAYDLDYLVDESEDGAAKIRQAAQLNCDLFTLLVDETRVETCTLRDEVLGAFMGVSAAEAVEAARAAAVAYVEQELAVTGSAQALLRRVRTITGSLFDLAEVAAAGNSGNAGNPLNLTCNIIRLAEDAAVAFRGQALADELCEAAVISGREDP
jgi:hypothetical protein